MGKGRSVLIFDFRSNLILNIKFVSFSARKSIEIFYFVSVLQCPPFSPFLCMKIYCYRISIRRSISRRNRRSSRRIKKLEKQKESQEKHQEEKHQEKQKEEKPNEEQQGEKLEKQEQNRWKVLIYNVLAKEKNVSVFSI